MPIKFQRNRYIYPDSGWNFQCETLVHTFTLCYIILKKTKYQLFLEIWQSKQNNAKYYIKVRRFGNALNGKLRNIAAKKQKLLQLKPKQYDHQNHIATKNYCPTNFHAKSFTIHLSSQPRKDDTVKPNSPLSQSLKNFTIP